MEAGAIPSDERESRSDPDYPGERIPLLADEQTRKRESLLEERRKRNTSVQGQDRIGLRVGQDGEALWEHYRSPGIDGLVSHPPWSGPFAWMRTTDPAFPVCCLMTKTGNRPRPSHMVPAFAVSQGQGPSQKDRRGFSHTKFSLPAGESGDPDQPGGAPFILHEVFRDITVLLFEKPGSLSG